MQEGYIFGYKWKLKRLVQLLLRNVIFIFLIAGFFLSSSDSFGLVSKLINDQSSLNKVTYDFIIIVISIYVGNLLFTDVLNIIKQERIHYFFKSDDNIFGGISQLILNFEIKRDFFNFIFGSNKHYQLKLVKSIINNKDYLLKWGSSVEPIDYIENQKNGNMILDPSKINFENKTVILEQKSDYLIILWFSKLIDVISKEPVSLVYCIADVWKYNVKMTPDTLIVRPLNIWLLFESNSENEKISIAY